MQARLIAYPPDCAAVVRRLGAGQTLRIGRAEGCDLRLEHPSISREHAMLWASDEGWRLRDLDSKNGSFLDGSAVDDSPIAGDCWLRFGDVYCEFAPLSETEAEAEAQGQVARRAAVTARTARIQRLTGLHDLIEDSLRAVLELAQCERGFVLLDQGDGLAVRATLAMDPTRLAAREFSGSVGAVRRALETGRPVVANDIGGEAWLAARHSVVAAGLSALACLPLLEEGRAFGAIYVDRVRPGPAITELDLELLQAFVEGAAVWIAAQRTATLLDAQVDDRRESPPTRWDGIVAAHADAS
jgi:hypothetical protein